MTDGSENEKSPVWIRCSFCGKHQDEVARLVAGPGVFICDECVEKCKEILAEQEDSTT